MWVNYNFASFFPQVDEGSTIGKRKRCAIFWRSAVQANSLQRVLSIVTSIGYVLHSPLVNQPFTVSICYWLWREWAVLRHSGAVKGWCMSNRVGRGCVGCRGKESRLSEWEGGWVVLEELRGML